LAGRRARLAGAVSEIGVNVTPYRGQIYILELAGLSHR
jgi:hypothetical protein